MNKEHNSISEEDHTKNSSTSRRTEPGNTSEEKKLSTTELNQTHTTISNTSRGTPGIADEQKKDKMVVLQLQQDPVSGLKRTADVLGENEFDPVNGDIGNKYAVSAMAQHQVLSQMPSMNAATRDYLSDNLSLPLGGLLREKSLLPPASILSGSDYFTHPSMAALEEQLLLRRHLSTLGPHLQGLGTPFLTADDLDQYRNELQNPRTNFGLRASHDDRMFPLRNAADFSSTASSLLNNHHVGTGSALSSALSNHEAQSLIQLELEERFGKKAYKQTEDAKRRKLTSSESDFDKFATMPGSRLSDAPTAEDMASLELLRSQFANHRSQRVNESTVFERSDEDSSSNATSTQVGKLPATGGGIEGGTRPPSSTSTSSNALTDTRLHADRLSRLPHSSNAQHSIIPQVPPLPQSFNPSSLAMYLGSGAQTCQPVSSMGNLFSQRLKSPSRTSSIGKDSGIPELPLHFNDRPFVSLGTEEDPIWLSRFLCFLRTQCIEVFAAQEVDVEYRRSAKTKVEINQLGLRCRFCAHKPYQSRGKRSSCFPGTVSRIYQSVTMMIREHFRDCDGFPTEVRECYDTLKNETTKGELESKRYWAQSASKIGMVDTEKGIFAENGGSELSSQPQQTSPKQSKKPSKSSKNF